MALCLLIVFCMAELGIGISRKTPRTEALGGRKNMAEGYLCKRKHTLRRPLTRHRQQEHG